MEKQQYLRKKTYLNSYFKYLSIPWFVFVRKHRGHNTGSTAFMEEIYRHTQGQKITGGRSSQHALCPACIMVDLHIEYASMNLTTTAGKADTVNKNKCCKKAQITSFSYTKLRWPLMKHGICILSWNSLVKQVMQRLRQRLNRLQVYEHYHLQQIFSLQWWIKMECTLGST